MSYKPAQAGEHEAVCEYSDEEHGGQEDDFDDGQPTTGPLELAVEAEEGTCSPTQLVVVADEVGGVDPPIRLHSLSVDDVRGDIFKSVALVCTTAVCWYSHCSSSCKSVSNVDAVVELFAKVSRPLCLPKFCIVIVVVNFDWYLLRKVPL